MKAMTICPLCSPFNDVASQRVAVEITDNGITEIACSGGHKTFAFAQVHKYEILFDMASMALLDGYHREAVATFAAAQERALEFYIRVALKAAGVPTTEVESTWKDVNNQSERQLGAFLFLRLLLKKAAAPTQYLTEKVGKSKAYEFRNAVVHKGYIPSRNEAYAFGDVVYRFINSAIDEVVSSWWAEAAALLADAQAAAETAHPGIVGYSHPTIISAVKRYWARSAPADLPSPMRETLTPAPDFGAALAKFEEHYCTLVYPQAGRNRYHAHADERAEGSQ